jgi:hypothetical protein
MITHVDQDHILGVLAMLEDVERPEEFSVIWFNGFDRLNDNEFESFGPVDGEFRTTAIIEQACRGTTRSAGVRSRWPADTVRRHGGVHDRRAGSHAAREPDPRWAQECRNNGLIPGVDPQEPLSDEGFESFGAMNFERLNGWRRVNANPTTRRQTCQPSGFCRFDSMRILFTGDADVPVWSHRCDRWPRTRAAASTSTRLRFRTTTAITTFPESCWSSSTVGTT